MLLRCMCMAYDEPSCVCSSILNTEWKVFIFWFSLLLINFEFNLPWTITVKVVQFNWNILYLYIVWWTYRPARRLRTRLRLLAVTPPYKMKIKNNKWPVYEWKGNCLTFQLWFAIGTLRSHLASAATCTKCT